jgi:4-amino-4-deoxy-L-arabinose transferase-like glycosyltransferase
MDDSTRSLLPYLPIVIALLILVRRTRRPRTLHPIRIWLGPLIVLAMSGFYLFMAVRYGPRVQPLGWLIMLGTAAVGIGLGAVRAHSVRLKRHPETGAIEATLSAWGLLIIVVWIAGRMLLRQSGLVDVRTPFGLYTDATMALALGLVLTQAIVLTLRCRSLDSQLS